MQHRDSRENILVDFFYVICVFVLLFGARLRISLSSGRRGSFRSEIRIKKMWETWRLFHITLSVSMGVRERALDSIVSLMSIRDTIVTIYSFTFASPLSRCGLSLYLPISVRRELSRHFSRSWLALSSYFSFSCNLCPCRLTGDDSLIHSGLLFPARIQFT